MYRFLEWTFSIEPTWAGFLVYFSVVVPAFLLLIMPIAYTIAYMVVTYPKIALPIGGVTITILIGYAWYLALTQ